MKRVPLNRTTKLIIENVEGFLIRDVTPIGTSAKVNCPKEYLGKTVYLVILHDKPQS